MADEGLVVVEVVRLTMEQANWDSVPSVPSVLPLDVMSDRSVNIVDGKVVERKRKARCLIAAPMPHRFPAA